MPPCPGPKISDRARSRSGASGTAFPSRAWERAKQSLGTSELALQVSDLKSAICNARLVRLQHQADRRRQHERFVDLGRRVGDEIHTLIPGNGVAAALAVDVVVAVLAQHDVVAGASDERIAAIAAENRVVSTAGV